MIIKRGGLGKGLDALLAENSLDNASKTVTLRISRLNPTAHSRASSLTRNRWRNCPNR